MEDYRELYFSMVRASEKASRKMEEAEKILITAQQECEELFCSEEEKEQ